MQVRLAQSLSISKFPVSRGNNKTSIANLFCFFYQQQIMSPVSNTVLSIERLCAIYQSIASDRVPSFKFCDGYKMATERRITHMRGSPGIIRLDVVKPDECVFPTTPSARSLQQIPSAMNLNLHTIASAAVRRIVTCLSDSDDHVRSPEIRLECGARVGEHVTTCATSVV
jgi:hypothetical protein